MENSGGSGVGPVMAAYCLETSLGLGPEARCTPIGRMLPDLRLKLPRNRDEVDKSVLLPEGRVPSPLSRAEVGLGDLGKLGTTLERLGISEPVETQILFFSENF